MKIIFFGKGNRGVACLTVLQGAGYTIPLVVVSPEDEGKSANSVAACARGFRIPVVAPHDPNTDEIRARLVKEEVDLFVLGGYGKILRQEIIDLPKIMCINLHGGKLPQYRGSSPLNWALIRGEASFTLSIIKIDSGVDTGPVLHERTFPIGINETIADLHAIAESQFPQMLIEVVSRLAKDQYEFIPKKQSETGYFPLRFPQDGLIFWDMHTAEQIHNRIRALTDPYPGAFTLFQGRKVKLLRSELTGMPYYGEPGRIYRKLKQGLLVCASDRCLWVTKAVFEDDRSDTSAVVQRYDQFATVRQAAFAVLHKNNI